LPPTQEPRGLAPGPGASADAAKPWVDCQSTGAWGREVEDSILLRAKLLSHRYRDPD
jgi:hypothetical protein